MSATDLLIDALVEAGYEWGEAAGMVARAGAEMAAGPSKGALRTRKWRKNKPSQTVTGDAPQIPEQNVTERHKPSPSVTSDKAPLSSLLTSSEQKLSEKKEKREAKRATQLPDGWRPDERAWQATLALIGLERCDLELKKFHRHAADKGRVSKNWNAAWENWVEKAIEYGAKNGNRTGNTRTTGHDAILAVAARKARELDRNDDLAGTAGAAGFAFGDGINRSGPCGNPDQAGPGERDHHRGEPDDQRIREGEIIPPDKNAAGVPGGRQFV